MDPMSGWGDTFHLVRLVQIIEAATRGLGTIRRSESESDPRVPKTFAIRKDAAGRYAICYPAQWQVDDWDGFLAVSPLFASFARVDVVDSDPTLWDDLGYEIERGGGKLKIEKRWKAYPEEVEGTLELASRKYRWSAWAYVTRDGAIVLALGDAVDPSRSRLIEKYERAILERIRRHFRVISPPA
jgi:hypothetical protein